MNTKKKGLRRKLKCFFLPKLGEDQKKKVFAENRSGFLPKLGEELDLFCLTIQRSNVDGETPKSRWGDAKSRWGDAKSRWGTRPPYNLSTGLLRATVAA